MNATQQRAPRFRTFPASMPMMHRRQYVKNLREIRFNERHSINAGWNEALKNTNALLIQLYLAPRP